MNPADWIKRNFGEAFCGSFILFVASWFPLVLFWHLELIWLFLAFAAICFSSVVIFVCTMLLVCSEENRKNQALLDYRKRHSNGTH